jgi:hypothetical protein
MEFASLNIRSKVFQLYENSTSDATSALRKRKQLKIIAEEE